MDKQKDFGKDINVRSKMIEEMAKEVYDNSNYSEVMSKDIARYIVKNGYRKIHKDEVVLTREEFERFQRIENTIKRISTVPPTEAEMENKALKETISIVLAQKRNIWTRYNQVRKETAEEFAKIFQTKLNELIPFDRCTLSQWEQLGPVDILEVMTETCKEIMEGK
jgi:hypothetical protein